MNLKDIDLGVGTWTNRHDSSKIAGALICDKSTVDDARLWDAGKKHFFILAPSLKLTTLYSRLLKLKKRSKSLEDFLSAVKANSDYKIMDLA